MLQDWNEPGFEDLEFESSSEDAIGSEKKRTKTKTSREDSCHLQTIRKCGRYKDTDRRLRLLDLYDSKNRPQEGKKRNGLTEFRLTHAGGPDSPPRGVCIIP